MTNPEIKSDYGYSHVCDMEDFLDSLPHMVLEFDLEGNVIYCNKATLDAFGYTHGDIKRGLSVFDLIVSEQKVK